MQRLAALVPRPRLHLIRFHGVLAPNAKPRALVVPREVPREAPREVPQAPEPSAQESMPPKCEANCEQLRPLRRGWAALLKRVFDLDLEHCPNCLQARTSPDPSGRASGLCCARRFSVTMDVLRRRRVSRSQRPRKTFFGRAFHAQQV